MWTGLRVGKRMGMWIRDNVVYGKRIVEKV
jgi:hypothetical protein